MSPINQSERFKMKTLTLKTLCLIAIFCGSISTAFSQEYPNRPIRIIVPFAPGGVVDVTTRLLTQKMTERLGWNFIVDNKPGGNGFIAVTAAATSPPDGYTLLMAHTGEFSVNPAIFPNIPYSLEKDFSPITMISDTPMLLVANSKTPYNTYKEMIAEAKKNPDALSFSSPGNGSINHLAGEWIALESGIKILHVPYKGGAPAVAAVASGEVPLGVVAVPAVAPHILSGNVKVITLTTNTKTNYNKSWATTQEDGIGMVNASNWVGLFAPKAVPDPIIQKLYKEVLATIEQPEVKKNFADKGADVGGMPPQKFNSRIREDLDRYKEIVKKANLRIQ
jgi:tripartite-type tricarboxylate transporter receptor subunit TctC